MKTVIHSYNYSIDYLREQIADVPSADLACQPNGITNHPAWTIGHLSFASQLLGGVIGLAPWLPDSWADRYGIGSKPVADASIYETKDRVLEVLRDSRSRIIRAVEELDEARLDAIFPVESYRAVFPTIRHAFTQVLVGHTAYHVGQVGLWRRAMDLPPMRRSYE